MAGALIFGKGKGKLEGKFKSREWEKCFCAWLEKKEKKKKTKQNPCSPREEFKPSTSLT